MLAPLFIIFILYPYLRWRKIQAKPVDAMIASSTVPTDREKVHLSVIVPAYNEQERLSPMLNEAIAYLNDRRNSEPKYTWEVIVVDDESSDSTYDLASSFNTEATPIYAIRLKKNTGKGGAVRVGVLKSVGEYILMVDADGATRFSDIEKLESSMNDSGAAIAVGSRDHLRFADSVKKRSPVRNFLMKCFHLAVLVIIGTGIKDTQCGFKLFARGPGIALFNSLHLERWAFDTEIIFLSNLLNFKITETPVEWTEIPGSKLNLIIGSVQMLRDMILLRLMYALSIWRPVV